MFQAVRPLIVLLALSGVLGLIDVSRSTDDSCTDVAKSTAAICSGEVQLTLTSYSNLQPSGPQGTNVTLWVEFNITIVWPRGTAHSIWVKQDVGWCHPFTGASLPGQLQCPANGSSSWWYCNASLNVDLSDRDSYKDNYGIYVFYVCGKEVQNFTVRPPPKCTSPSQSHTHVTGINESAVVPAFGGNLSVICHFQGYSGFSIQWNDSASVLNSPRYIPYTDYAYQENCTFYSRLVIVNAIPDYKKTYTCSVMDGKRVIDSRATNLTVIDLLSFSSSPQDQKHNSTESLLLEYEIRGDPYYMDFHIRVNNLKLDHYCTSSQCNVSISPLPSGHRVIYSLNIIGGTLPPNNYTFQACARYNEIVSCDCKPIYSNRSLITIQKDEPTGGPYTVIIASVAGGGGLFLVAVLLTVVGLTIKFCFRRHRQRLGYNPLDDRHPENIPRVSVIPHPPIIVGSPLVHTEDLEREGVTQRVLIPKKVFIVYEISTKGFEIENLCDILNVLSHTPQGRAFTCDCDIQHRSEVSIDWSNWTVQKIQEADVVLLICSPELHSCLSQCKDSTPIQTAMGPVSAAAIANLCSILEDSARKFIPVFLNQPIDPKLVPASLAGRKAYEVKTAGLMAILSDGKDEEEFSQSISEYLRDHQEDETKDLIELVQCLGHNN